MDPLPYTVRFIQAGIRSTVLRAAFTVALLGLVITKTVATTATKEKSAFTVVFCNIFGFDQYQRSRLLGIDFGGREGSPMTITNGIY